VVARQDTRLEAEGAEFLVLGYLLLEGITAFKAYTNTRGHDVVAVNPLTGRTARIQVKSRWATDANSHLIKNFDCEFVVLARLNRGFLFSGARKRERSAGDAPEFYILPVKTARESAVTTGWGKILWSAERFAEYRDRWDLIVRHIAQPVRPETDLLSGTMESA
jgi:hypothetical protein